MEIFTDTDSKSMVDKVNSDEFACEEFDRGYYEREPKKPVLLKDEVVDWEATQKWDPEYLDCVLGHKEATVLFHEEGMFDPNEKPEDLTLPFSEAHEYIQEDGRYYVAQAAIERPWISRFATGTNIDFPRLAEDIQQPRFLNDLSKLHLVTNVWFGGDQCKSPLHYDISHNFFSQIFGKKRVLLASPSQTDYLYPAYGARSPRQSRVDVFDPDESKFPRYKDAECAEIFVEPGDMLFIPEGWWHAVETVTTSISVNFWWNGVYPYVNHLFSSLFQRLKKGSIR